MILVRSPLRVTLGGGGTDLPEYRGVYGGFCVSAAIDKYVYVSVVNPFTPGIYLKYAKLQDCSTPMEVENPHIRRALEMTGVERVALTTFADIPAGTGLGSSGAISCALLKALSLYTHKGISTEPLARQAYRLEVDIGMKGGSQDQYASAFGGLNAFTFHKGGEVGVHPLNISPEMLAYLESHLLLYFTGYTRESGDAQVTPSDSTMDNLHEVKALGHESLKALEGGDIGRLSYLLNEQWQLKESRKPSPPRVVEMRDRGMGAGSLACKLIGAGGGGFLMFLTDNPRDVEDALGPSTHFKFDFEGTRVMA